MRVPAVPPLVILVALAGGWFLSAARTDRALAVGDARAAAVAATSCWLAAAAFVVIAVDWWRRREAPVRAGALRWLLYTALGGAAGALYGAGPYSPEKVQHWFTIASGVFAGSLVAGPVLMRALPARLRTGADLVLMNVSLVVLLGEAGLRALSEVVRSPLLARGNASVRDRIEWMRPDAGSVRYGFPLNSRGYFDTEFEPKTADIPLLVASIADSFATGPVPHSHHFTTVCERELPGCTVYNFGIPAVGPWEYLELARSEALPLRPDVVVVNLFVGNDLPDVRFRKEPGLLEQCFRREGFLLDAAPRRLAKLMRESRATSRPAHRVAAAQGEGGGHCPWVDDPSLEEQTFSPEQFREIEVGRAGTICRGDDAEYGLLEAALEEIVQACSATRLLFVLIPDELQVEDAVWEEVLAHAGRGLERDRAQRRIVEWCRRRGTEVLDLLPELRAVPPLPDGRRHCYHLRDTHFNARGNRVVGEALARRLRPFLP